MIFFKLKGHAFFFFFFFSRTEVGVLAKQYLERGLLVPDHVITRVMMSELEKRREQPWLLDGECAAGIPAGRENPSPLSNYYFAANGLAAPGEREKTDSAFAGGGRRGRS